jgi:hypothetical protein
VLSWLTGVTPGRALVFLPGTEGVTPNTILDRLRANGVTETDVESDAPWRIRVDDTRWGSASIQAAPDAPDPEPAIRFASNLSDVDKTHVRPPYSAVAITAPAQSKRVLADRKTLLRYAAAVMGDTGLITLDLQSRLPWTREALADELGHDADLDIEALYTIEHVYMTDAAGKRTVEWVHTHGLGDVGAFDVDVLAPHPDFVDRGHEAFRAIAQLALAKKVSIDSGEFVFGRPGGVARAVRAPDFMRQAEPRWRDLRSGPDHDEDRAVLCDPAGGGLLGFLRRDSGPVPMSFARRPIPETFASLVPTEFNELMAERAAKTIGVLRRYRDEFAAIEPVTLVKLGYPTRSGDREHLWFQVHEMGDDWIEGTLGNRPFDVDLEPGVAGRHSLDLLSDWVLLTPAGQISPRSSHVARILREQPPPAAADAAGG